MLVSPVDTVLSPVVTASTHLGSYYLHNSLALLQLAHCFSSALQPLLTLPSLSMAHDSFGTPYRPKIDLCRMRQRQILSFLKPHEHQPQSSTRNTHIDHQDPIIIQPPSPMIQNTATVASTTAKKPEARKVHQYQVHRVDNQNAVAEHTSMLERRRYLDVIQSRKKRQRRKEKVERLNQQYTYLQEEQRLLKMEEMRLLNLLQTAEYILYYDEKDGDAFA
jgi:hypothetical protein